MVADPFKFERRLGRFVLTRGLMEDRPEVRELVQHRVLIEELERDWTNDSLKIIGRAPCFAIVKEGERIPLYTVVVRPWFADRHVKPHDFEFRLCEGPPVHVSWAPA